MKKFFSILAIIMMVCSQSMWASTTAVQPSSGDGSADSPYEIATAGNLVWFANQVNAGSTTICGRLTADIDMSADNSTMIGTSTNKYSGTFDGGYHTVNLSLTTTPNEDYVALFRYISGATIKNLCTSGLVYSKQKYAAGIAAYCENSTIQSCQCSAVIMIYFTTTGAGYHGGIVAHVVTESTLKDLMYTGGFVLSLDYKNFATNCGGIVGLAACSQTVSNALYAPVRTIANTSMENKTIATGDNVTIDNCYYTTTLGTAQGTSVTDTQRYNGELCYMLNKNVSDGSQAWYQDISSSTNSDLTFKSNGENTVYYGDDACPNTKTYSNVTHSMPAAYTDGIKICTNDGCTLEEYEACALDEETSTCTITNKGNLIWFANQVNAGNTIYNATLTADIDLGDYQTMIGTSSKMYAGTFDGGNHTVTVAYTGTERYTGLFQHVSGATIQNLSTAGTISTGYMAAAGIVAHNNGTLTMNNCKSSVAITSTFETDQTGDHGGIIGDNGGTATLTNILFDGKLLGEHATDCGGIIGWTWTGATLKGCLFNPSEVTFSTSGSYTMSRGNNLTITDCYYVTAFGTTQGTATTSATLASGEVCYKLNGSVSDGTQSWYQNLSETTDATPVLDSTHGTVFGGKDACPYTDGTTYSNTTHPGFGWKEGRWACTNNSCSYFDEGTYKPATFDEATNAYVIEDYSNLIWFANKVNAGETAINARLTDDINLQADQTMIGTSSNKFAGIFDGGSHTVTVAYTPTESYTALFRYISGATIKNLKTAGTINTAYQFAAGMVAYLDGAVTISGCQSSVEITNTFSSGSDATTGGIAARCEGTVTIANTIFDGKLLGSNAQSSGGLLGWSRNSATITGCLFMPKEVTFSSTSAYTLGRGNGVTIKNSYYTKTLGTAQGTIATDETLVSGAVCYGLTGGTVDGTQAWYQNLDNGSTPDTTPVIDSTHGTVYGGTTQCPYGTYSNTQKLHVEGTTYSEDEGLLQCGNSGCTYTYAGKYNPPTYDSGSGQYLIATLPNLLWFMTENNSGNTTYNAKLTADIDLGSKQTKFGTYGNSNTYYKGTFDGDGHTITVAYSSKDECPTLFAYVNGATIKNLKTSGSASSYGNFLSGFVGYGIGNITMINCQSDMTLTNPGNTNNESNGGIIGASNESSATLTLTNCLFNGTMVGNRARSSGGLAGWVRGKAVITNCLFAPTSVGFSTSGSYTLCRAMNSSNVTATNSYYSTQFGTAQGTKVTTDKMASGELCFLLNGSSADGAWGQTSEQSYPVVSGKGMQHYSRSMTNQWGTICLPFSVNADNNDDFDFYALSSVSASTITLTKITGIIAAGTPVVIRRNASVTSVDVTRNGTDKAESPVTGSSAGGLTLTGTYTKADITNQDGYIIANNSFWKIKDLAYDSDGTTHKTDDNGNNITISCNPFRAYLAGTIASDAKELVIGLGDDTPTAVETLDAITSGEVEYYDINGCRINDLQQGVNIVKYGNGITKKVIIKDTTPKSRKFF